MTKISIRPFWVEADIDYVSTGLRGLGTISAMGQKISEMTAAGSLTGTEQIEVVQGGLTRRTTTQSIADLAPPAGVQSVVAGSGITVDSSDPENPIVSATGGGGSVDDSTLLRASAQYRGNGSSIDSVGFVALTIDTGGGTAAGTFTPSGTKGQILPRLVGDSGVGTVGVGVDFYGAQTPFYRDVTGSGTPGFTFNALVMMEAILDTQCVFLGVCNLNSNAMFNLVTEPSQFSSIAAFAKDSTDTYLQFMLASGGSLTKTPLTGITVSGLVNHLLRARIVATDTEVSYSLLDLETGVEIASGSVSVNMPAADAQLFAHLALQTKASGPVTAVKLGFLKLTVDR